MGFYGVFSLEIDVFARILFEYLAVLWLKRPNPMFHLCFTFMLQKQVFAGFSRFCKK